MANLTPNTTAEVLTGQATIHDPYATDGVYKGAYKTLVDLANSVSVNATDGDVQNIFGRIRGLLDQTDQDAKDAADKKKKDDETDSNIEYSTTPDGVVVETPKNGMSHREATTGEKPTPSADLMAEARRNQALEEAKEEAAEEVEEEDKTAKKKVVSNEKK